MIGSLTYVGCCRRSRANETKARRTVFLATPVIRTVARMDHPFDQAIDNLGLFSRSLKRS